MLAWINFCPTGEQNFLMAISYNMLHPDIKIKVVFRKKLHSIAKYIYANWVNFILIMKGKEQCWVLDSQILETYFSGSVISAAVAGMSNGLGNSIFLGKNESPNVIFRAFWLQFCVTESPTFICAFLSCQQLHTYFISLHNDPIVFFFEKKMHQLSWQDKSRKVSKSNCNGMFFSHELCAIERTALLPYQYKAMQ